VQLVLLFISDKSPQVQLQIVRIDLNLLQAIATKSTKSHTLQKRLHEQSTLHY